MKLIKYVWLRCSALFAASKMEVPSGGLRAGFRLQAPWRPALRTMALGVAVLLLAGAALAGAQAVSTTTVQGTVYLANGQPGAGTLAISWPAFTTAAGQAVAADSTTVTIAPDGFVSVNLAPNVGATPAGEFYTAVYYMSDGSTSTQYWVVPAASSASLAQVQAQVMPAAQAVQAVSKAYVDQAITELSQSSLTTSGGTLSGPLYLSSDPTQPLQAADKHYVDVQVATAVPIAGGNMTGALTSPEINGVQAPSAVSGQTTLQSAMTAAGTNGAMEIPPTYAGTDTFTNPNGVRVTDLRTGVAQQAERSVKEFGAVCDGATDDTNALEAAINYANAHGVALTIPEGTCKTRTLSWHGESIGGLGKQVSALMGFPGEDVLASGPDATNMLSYTRLHDLTIYVDQSADASCTPAAGRAAAGSCQMSRAMEGNSIFSPGGHGLNGTAGTGAGWWVGNCAIAMQAATGAGGNGLKVAEIENVEIATTGVDPMAAQYPGAHSTHTCGMYLAQWPQWSEFRNIDVRGLNTGVAIPALPVTAPAGLNADSNRWQNVTIQATHAFTAAVGSNNVLDNVVAMAGNSSATGEPPTGLVLDLNGTAQGWTVRNAVVMPAWIAVQPALTVTAAGGAVTAVTVGSQAGLGWDPYGTSVPVAFSGSCTAQATAAVNANGSIASVTVTQGGVGCSATTMASVNAAGSWDTAAPVNLIGGQDMTFFAGNLLKGSGGYTVWNATSSTSYGTQLDGGGGTLPGGGTYVAMVGSSRVGPTFVVDQFPGADIGAKIQACLNVVNSSYGGTCDARNFTGSLSMASNLTISTGNTAVLLPCAEIATANQIVVTAGTRNVALRGCALRGGTAASGSQGGTAFAYSGTGAMVQVGDPTYATDTPGFHMDNVVINTTGAAGGAQGLVAYRTQELDLESLYFLGNSNQTGMTLDGTGNYTGGTFLDNEIGGFGTAVNAIGHQVANPATTDWMNASTFVRLHIDCPTSSGSPISGTYGINLQQGDGNTFTGGDVEGCATALHLGPNAQNNTIVGLRNERSTSQVVADAGSAYNNWMTGGTMFTGQLTDNGTRNSFLDTFHRSFNGLNGDWYGSQQDATVTNHFRLGIGMGNERGQLNEIQTDYGYRWEDGYTDGTSGEQFWNLTDLVNGVQRISVGQYLSATANAVTNVVVNNGGCYTSSTAPAVSFTGGGGSGAAATANLVRTNSMSCPAGYTVGSVTVTAGGSGYTSQPSLSFTGSNQMAAPNAVAEIAPAGSTNSQTAISSAGTGAIVLNGSAGAGTGGVVIDGGGPTPTEVANFDNTGDLNLNGYAAFYASGALQWDWACASASVCELRNAGATIPANVFRAFPNGDTEIDSQGATAVVVNNTSTAGTGGFAVYEGGANSGTRLFSVSGTVASPAYYFPGIESSGGYNCLQVDTSGYVTNTGAACGSGSGSGSGGMSGTINSGSSGQIAYYTASGTTIGGMSAVPLNAGGTGASSASGAMANLLPGVASDGNNGVKVAGNVATAESLPATSPYADIRAYGAVIDGSTPIDTALNNAIAAQCPAYNRSVTGNASCVVLLPCELTGGAAGCYLANGSGITYAAPNTLVIKLQGTLKLGSTLVLPANVKLVGDGGGYPANFQIKGSTGSIQGPQVTGTLGTAITSTGTPVTFTPTFANGSISNLKVNSAITVAGLTSCTASVTRSAGQYFAEQYVATCSSYVRIPPAALITVTGCSDSSFDVTSTPVITSDYTAQSLMWVQSTSATPGTATGCTITGFNNDSFETVLITAVSGSTATATFAHTHSASDQFGEVAAEVAPNDLAFSDIEDISINTCKGACLWLPSVQDFTLANDGFSASPIMTSIAVEIDAGLGTIRDSAFSEPVMDGPPLCTSGCPGVAYPEGLRCTNVSVTLGSPSGYSGCGYVNAYDNTFFGGGVKADTNGTVPSNLALPNFYNNQFRELSANAITIDNRNVSVSSFIDDNPVIEDNFLGSNTICFIGQTDGAASGGSSPVGQVDLRGLSTASTPCIVNPYFNGPFTATNTDGMNLTLGRGSPVGSYTSDGALLQEIRGVGASLAPSVVPFPLLPTLALTCAGSCTISTGKLFEDGTTSAVEVDATGGNAYAMAGNAPLATYPGDHFLIWSWVRPGANAVNLPEPVMGLRTSGTDTFNPPDVHGYGMELINDWWHPVVGLQNVVVGDSTPHYIQLALYAPWSGAGDQFNDWGWTLIPGPNNPAYAGATIDMVEQWRQELLHGAIPQNYAGGGSGHAVTTEQIDAPGFNIVSPSTGAVTALASTNLGDSSVLVRNNQANVYGAYLQDFSGATIKLPVAAGYAPGANGGIGYDSTNFNWHGWLNGSDSLFALMPTSGLTSGHCAEFLKSTNSWSLQDAGSACGSGSSGTINNASQYSPVYYSASGSANTLSGVTPFTGLAYYSTSAAPAGATGAQIVSAIGTTAVTNATNFAGSLSGDVTGTQTATSVGKINGGAVPASATVLGTNSSGQPVAAATTGSGNAVLATSPTLTTPVLGVASATSMTTSASSTLEGSANIFNNAAATANIVEIQAGTTAAQTEEIQWQNYSGTAEWLNSVDTSYTYHIKDVANSLDRVTIYQGAGNTNINAGSGAYAVCLNCAASSGTSGLLVQSGGASPSTELTVTGAGNTTATGFVSGRFFIGGSTMTLTAGAAAGTSPSIACATNHVCDGVSGTVTLTTGTSPTTGTLATLGFPNTHSNYANCLVSTESSSAVITSDTWTESTTAITITANTAPAASTAYTVKYWCGGN